MALENMQNPIIQPPEITETSQQNPAPKRKRTAHSKVEPHKRRRSVIIELSQRISANLRDESNQPVEAASPVRIRDSESEEEALGSEEEPKEEAEEEAESESEPEEEAPGSEEEPKEEPEEEAKSESEPKEAAAFVNPA